MPTIAVPNRPFSSEPITGMQLPDGIFETSIGVQRINAHFKNQGFSVVSNVNVYIESVSDPGIVITPQTYAIGNLASNAASLLFWKADFSGATPGLQYVSFIAEDASGRTRIIKKIFVTKVSFDPGTKIFSALTPEGSMQVGFYNFVGPTNVCCRRSKPSGYGAGVSYTTYSPFGSFLDVLREVGGTHDPKFELCLREYLLSDLWIEVTPNPTYPGQYGDLPFQDPWWKVVLCIIAVILLIAAGIAGAVGGGAHLTVSGGPSGGPTPPSGDCCGVSASGGGSSSVAAGLVAAAAAAATAAGMSDVRDPFRRGQDNTMPAAGELTTKEHLDISLSYPEPVVLGKPFAVKAAWKYTRVTTGATYTYSTSETNNNIHVLDHYEIDAPNVVRLYKQEQPWVIKAKFFGPGDKLFVGEQLFVQCFLIGPTGQYASFVLQDDGIQPDDESNDGVYTGAFSFQSLMDGDPRGIWKFFVIAQDINSAQPGMTPDEAAKIIGGMVLTNQLTISFTGGTCPLVPDGDVNVIG